MKFRKETKSEVTINLTPLIDVVFLLLIFFMVSTTFKKNTQLSVQLPHASAKSSQMQPDAIRVSIDSSGQFELDAKVYPQEDLPMLAQALKEKYNSEHVLLIMGDKQAPHQALVSLLEVAADLKLNKIRILAQFEENKSVIN